ncbi:MAG: hypothetical protein JXA54_04965 [Candidatus Heimdallarchaeota archaeon]|nr:hypothetical protein [Candidatus Heimdallarchaeota archaeon]
MSDEELHFVQEEEIDKLEYKSRFRKKLFENVQPKRRTIYMGMIFLSASLVINLLFSLSLNYSSLINNRANGVLDWLPGNFIIEMLFLWCILIVSFFIFLGLLPYLAKLYIYLHKLVKYFKYSYSTVKTDEHYYSFKEALGRILIPFLFSFILGYWLANWTYLKNLTFESHHVLVYMLFSLIVMPITIVLITPLWLLDDTGIIAIKKRKEGERRIPDIEGPTVFFYNIYSGSAYTLALVTIIDFLIEIFRDFNAVVFIAFFIIIILVLPSGIIAIIYLYELFMRNLKPRLCKILPQKLVDPKPKTLVDAAQKMTTFQLDEFN